jgi:hypothetical protein
MEMLERVGEKSDVNFMMKELPANKQFSLVNKLKSMELLIDKKQKHKRQVLIEEKSDDI